MHVAVGFAERPLGFQEISGQTPFDHQFRVSGNLQIDGLAFHQLNRLSGQSAGYAVFILAVGNFLDTSVGNNGRATDDNRSFEWRLFFATISPVNDEMLRRAEAYTEAGLRFY